MRFAKIVCTLGPSSNDHDSITKLIEAGMDVARLNFSHGTHESHAKLIQTVRQCSQDLNKPVAILQDLQGPKLRVGNLPIEGIQLEAGQILNLYTVGFGTEDFLGEQKSLPLDVPNLARGVKPGNRIWLDDGHLALQVKEVKGELKGLKLCYVGDGNNVAHSLMFAGARLGVDVTVACPAGYEPNLIAFQHATEDAKLTGATISVVHDPAEGVKNADVVYTDVWASMGQEAEAAERRRIFLPFQVNEDLMAKAKKDAIFMHCLPAHRGDEVTDGVIDAPNSVVFQEAENRLHAQKAVMYQLMKK